MIDTCPRIVSDYVHAVNARDLPAFGALFAPEAVVQDEGHEHRGVPAITSWLQSTADKYHFSLDPTRVAQAGPETVVTMSVSGDFPGSPALYQFHFELGQERIVRLGVGA